MDVICMNAFPKDPNPQNPHKPRGRLIYLGVSDDEISSVGYDFESRRTVRHRFDVEFDETWPTVSIISAH